MVYEKYIKKNGKLYGPYTYHSKRVNGRVVSEYHGTKTPSNNNFLWVIGLFVGVVLIAGLFFWNTQLIGEVTLDISPASQVGESLAGVLSFSLKEGELMPASSKVIFDIGGQSYEYTLSDIVTADTTSGNFYIEDKSISDSGIGYGVIGTKRVYPDVDFTLNILSESKSKKSESGEGGSNIPVEVSELVIEIPEVSEEISTPAEEVSILPVETEIIESPSVNEDLENPSVGEVVSETSETKTESKTEAKTEKSESKVESKLEKEETKSESKSTPEPVSTPSESESAPDTSVTGAVIANFFRNTLNAFLVLTGQVSLKLEQEVVGSVSFGESFVYDLAEGEIAELKENSVIVNGESLLDNMIGLDIINNQVVVTTDYSLEEEGFGEEYLDGTGETISIDLSKLNLELTGENIQVSFVYNNTELVSVSTSLGDEETPEENETLIEIPDVKIPETNISNVTEVPAINETIGNIIDIINITNVSEQNVSVIVVDLLTEDEKTILENKYENVSVEITKAEKVRGRIEVTFEIGDYSIKHSYDLSLSDSELGEWIEHDRIRLLKDIAYELSKEESSSEVIEGITGSYAI